VDLAQAGDGSGRLFVLEQIGVIRVIQDNQRQDQPFLDIRDRVGSQGNEQGLLGIAFHPDFQNNGFFYLNYTDNSGDTVISRFTTPVDANGSRPLADPASEKVLLQVDQPFANHNGGQVIFGPDGYLWIGLGDGGSGGDPRNNGQNPDTLLGKLLRIDVNQGDPYSIPADNPFTAGGGAVEVWALGLRNPWRFSFDSLTGDLYIGDVGQNQWEEVDYLPGGTVSSPVNFGWNVREGVHPYRDNMGEEGLVDPIFEYDHNSGCSITGGFVYRGKSLPDLNGVYLVGDYCSGLVWGLIPSGDGWTSDVLFRTGLSISSFGVDGDGEMYLMDLGGGVYKLEAR
jgi:glucose/arabinose dehydrogenase